MTDLLPMNIPAELDSLCKILSPCTTDDAVALIRETAMKSQIDWEGVAVFANRANLAPALHQALHAKGLWSGLPPRFQEYLDEMYRFNSERNKAILGQLREVVGVLNSANIIPLLMKGGAALATDLYPDPGVRFMMDMDMLIPENQLEQAVAVLTDSGYCVPDAHLESLELWQVRRSKHYPPLCKDGMPVHIELHRQLLDDTQQRLLQADKVWQDSHPVKSGKMADLVFAVMSPGHQILHCIIHSEIAHGNFRLQRADLRQMLHFTWLCQRYSREVDWGELGKQARQMMMWSEAGSFLYSAKLLFGVVTPLTPGDDPQAREHFEQVVSHGVDGRWNGLKLCQKVISHFREAFSAEGLKLRFPGEETSSIATLRLRYVNRLMGKYGSMKKIINYFRRQYSTMVKLG